MSSRSKSRSRSRSNQKYNAPTQPENSQEPKLYISGLAVDAQESDVRQAFASFGDLTDVFIRAKDTFSFAFVTYSNIEDATSAMNGMAGQSIGGRRIRVDFAKPRKPRDGENNGGGRGGFGGGGRGRGGFGGAGGDRPRNCFKCQQEGHFAR
jgi:RNA recognition motif-containing protein